MASRSIDLTRPLADQIHEGSITIEEAEQEIRATEAILKQLKREIAKLRIGEKDRRPAKTG